MEKLLWKEKLSYGIGAYGKDFIYNMIAAFLMIFYTDVVGVSLIFVSTLFLTVGFLGGLTTFSSFTNETLILWRTGDFISVLLNVGLNTFGGLLAAWIGRILIYMAF